MVSIEAVNRGILPLLSLLNQYYFSTEFDVRMQEMAFQGF